MKKFQHSCKLSLVVNNDNEEGPTIQEVIEAMMETIAGMEKHPELDWVEVFDTDTVEVEKEKHEKVYYKLAPTPVPFCPKCGKQVEIPRDRDFQSVATYRCNHCGYLQ